MTEAQLLLQKYWNFPSFRPGQEAIVADAAAGHDVLALLPTGGGKSICFQVPGLLREGLCVVVSPLIALMQDQVDALQAKGLRAKALTSELSYREIDHVLDNARFGGLDFLYTSPERLQSSLFIERFKRMKVSLLVVDEAHCISEWGHDFRPSFRQIANLRQYHPTTPVLALTATATKQVQADICSLLALQNVRIHEASFVRTNLAYQVRQSAHKLEDIITYCRRHEQVGIVYCQTRKSVKEVATQLHANGISCGIYHGGMSANERSTMLREWLDEKRRVMVATNAFGMGIDKPNVRFVLHYEIPASPEAYFQEAGRGGRDGAPASALLFWNDNELDKLVSQTEKRFPPKEKVYETYRAVANFLKLAIGSGKDESFPFDINQLCKAFQLDYESVYYSLKILEQNDNISLSEQFFQPTRIQLIVGKRELYNFQVQHESYQALCTLLLRSYPGIFEHMTRIHEAPILKRLNCDQARLYQQLDYMQQLGIIDYSKQSQLPSLTFRTERLPESYLQLNPSIYKERKEAAFAKLKAMQAFCRSEQCRAQQLIAYFGQESEPCGQCDVCLRKPFDQSHFQALLQAGATSDELCHAFSWTVAELEAQLRPLLQTEKISYRAKKFYLN
jgi:ATP-dependent DNA helicase RecQ